MGIDGGGRGRPSPSYPALGILVRTSGGTSVPQLWPPFPVDARSPLPGALLGGRWAGHIPAWALSAKDTVGAMRGVCQSSRGSGSPGHLSTPPAPPSEPSGPGRDVEGQMSPSEGPWRWWHLSHRLTDGGGPPFIPMRKSRCFLPAAAGPPRTCPHTLRLECERGSVIS